MVQSARRPSRDIVGIPPNRHRGEKTTHRLHQFVVAEEMAWSRLHRAVLAQTSSELLQCLKRNGLLPWVPNSPCGDPQVRGCEVAFLAPDGNEESGKMHQLMGFLNPEVDREDLGGGIRERNSPPFNPQFFMR